MSKEELKAYTESFGNTNSCTWCRKHQKITIGEKVMSCYKMNDENNEEDSNNDARLDSFARVYEINDQFECIHETHEGDYQMGRTLQNPINKKHGSSVIGWACKYCVDTCSMHVFK